MLNRFNTDKNRKSEAIRMLLKHFFSAILFMTIIAFFTIVSVDLIMSDVFLVAIKER